MPQNDSTSGQNMNRARVCVCVCGVCGMCGVCVCVVCVSSGHPPPGRVEGRRGMTAANTTVLRASTPLWASGVLVFVFGAGDGTQGLVHAL
jgi:hypothetical protein